MLPFAIVVAKQHSSLLKFQLRPLQYTYVLINAYTISIISELEMKYLYKSDFEADLTYLPILTQYTYDSY